MSEDGSYRQLNEELEKVIDKLQSSDLDVDHVIEEYKRGIVLIDKLEKYLESARNKVAKVNVKNTKK